MRKYLAVFCYSFIFFVFANTLNAKQLDNINIIEKEVQKLNIDTNSNISKTKILFLEPCNITKIKYNKDFQNEIVLTIIEICVCFSLFAFFKKEIILKHKLICIYWRSIHYQYFCAL